MPRMTWFWRLVCSPDCSEACQVDCPGCHEMAAEWQSQGFQPLVGDQPAKFQVSRIHELWSCWSSSMSARVLKRVGPTALIHQVTGSALAHRIAGCDCEPAPVSGAIKEEVRRHYGAQAISVMGGVQDGACCSPGLPADISCTALYDQAELRVLPSDALTASLGCGNPVALAELKAGEIVLDLGSGGGMDAFIAASRVGETGRVYALDMSDEMLTLARGNAVKVGAKNVEFLKGEMESIPLPDASVDVIISNCVVNLSPDKSAALREAHRVLRPNGRLAISDIVTSRPVPSLLKGSLTAWAACVGGALSEGEYRNHLTAAGFRNVHIEREREYTVADAEVAGLGPLLQRFGAGAVKMLGFASAGIRADRSSAQEPVLGAAFPIHRSFARSDHGNSSA